MKFIINGTEYEVDFVKEGYTIEIGDEFVIINGIDYDEEINDDNDLFLEILDYGELIFSINEIIEIKEYKGEFYLFYWDTESNHFFDLKVMKK
jgi:hypothetical protein